MIFFLTRLTYLLTCKSIREINFYKTESDQCPVEEFLDSLSSRQAQKVTWVLKLIEELPSVTKVYFKKLKNTEDIWEVRVGFGNDIFRILGFFDGFQLIILNHAFQKKTQKTPKQAIKIAKARKQNYLKRKKCK